MTYAGLMGVLAVTYFALYVGRLLVVLLFDGAERLLSLVRHKLYMRRLWKEHHRIYGGGRHGR